MVDDYNLISINKTKEPEREKKVTPDEKAVYGSVGKDW